MADTIAAISTGNAPGGIGVIRISGDAAIETAAKVFAPADESQLTELKGYRAKYGNIIIDGERADNAVALVFRAPRSYTGENVVELSVHGGLLMVQKTLAAVLSAGARPAQAGEFTKRAFLNGKIDLSEAEAVIDIISAKSRSAARAALCVKEGAVRNKIDEVKNLLLSTAAHLSAWADYPEEDIAEVTDEQLYDSFDVSIAILDGLISSYDSGQAVKQGIDTVIAGRPNVGKSTLMNLLSGCERSIVTDIPGTTRDIIEDTVIVGDVILRLSDTAGLRTTDDKVEKIGVDRAKHRLKQCGLLLAVFDYNRSLDDDDKELIESAGEVPCIAIINKTDLDKQLDTEYIESKIKNVVYLSAKSGDGRAELVKAVEDIAGMDNFNPSEGVLSNERQRQAVLNSLNSVKDAKNALEIGLTYDAITVSIEEAITSLLELTGERTSDEVVDRVFHNFCVGK